LRNLKKKIKMMKRRKNRMKKKIKKLQTIPVNQVDIQLHSKDV
jgi:hypothetical protein